MATGDVTIFDQHIVDTGNKLMDMDTDTFKFALINSTLAPTDADPFPHFGGTGTTDESVNEVIAGGNYAAGGVTMAGLSYSNSAGVVSWDADKILIAQHVSNPTNARWAIIYNFSDPNNRCVSFCDLGSVLDLTLGAFEFRFSTVDGNGTVFTKTVNA